MKKGTTPKEEKTTTLETPTTDSAMSALFREAVGATALLGIVASVVAGLLTPLVAPGATVPMWVFLVLVVILATSLTLALSALFKSVDRERATAERFRVARPQRVVVKCSSPYPPWVHAECILIVDWSGGPVPLVGGAVVLSLVEDGIERPLGFGTIRQPQTDGRIVVTLDTAHDGVEASIDKLRDPERCTGILEHLRVAESVMAEHFSSEMSRKQRRVLPTESDE